MSDTAELDSLVDRARKLPETATALSRFAAELPAEDAALAEALETALARNDERAFVNLLFAAFDAGRDVDAGVLERGGALVPDPRLFAFAAMHCSGDVPAALTTAYFDGRMGDDRDVVALAMAYAWCERHRDGEVPLALRNAVRLAGRSIGFSIPTEDLLALLAEKLQCFATMAVLGPPSAGGHHVYKGLLDIADGSLLSLYADGSSRVVHSGSTMRRAAPRIGRNEPCPCGSGKKYKRCCYDKDQERVSHSSDVPGVTHDEIREHPEPYLTRDRIQEMRCYELARIDPAEVAEELLPPLMQELLLFNEDDAAFRVFEVRSSWPNRTEDLWQAVEQFFARQRSELACRLIRLPGAEDIEGGVADLKLGLKLAEAPDEEAALLEALEQEACRALQPEARATPTDLAYALLHSRFPALGVLVARGQVVLGPSLEQDNLVDELMCARHRLGLSVDDPVEEVLDDRIVPPDPPTSDPRAEQELARTRNEIQEKEQEVHSMQKELNELRQNLKSVEKQRDRERERASANAPQKQEAAAKDAQINELRTRVRVLKSQVKERHEEKQLLRDELGRTRRQIRQDRKAASREEPQLDTPEQAEENLFEDPTPIGNQPPRVPTLTQRFEEALETLPEAAARKALRLIGQLAAGDDNAFRGTRKLKLHPSLLRQRVGMDHRLLFRIEDRTLVAEALVNRRDLERTIESLR